MTKQVYILVYVDDLLVMGDKPAVRDILQNLEQEFLLKDLGSLDHDGSSITFIGRELRRTGDAIAFRIKAGYFDVDFEHFGLKNCRPVSTPGITNFKHLDGGDEALSNEEHAFYRQSVGRSQWQVPIRPDIAFEVKELARNLNAPTINDQARLKHLLRYIRGTSSFYRH